MWKYLRSEMFTTNNRIIRVLLFCYLIYFYLTYNRCVNVAIRPAVDTKDVPISPQFTPYDFLSRYKFSTLRACINVEIEYVPRICLLTYSVDRSCFGY